MSDESTPAVTPSTAAARSAGGARGGTRRYPSEALRDHQPRLIDFIPQKITSLALLFFVGLLMIAGIEAVYITRIAELSEGHVPSFDLTAEGSLNNWFTSITLDLACVVALVVYSLRKHRLDDYHGRYRVWLWAAACWLWLSIDEAASLHESIQALLREFAHQSAGETELAWIGGYILLAGAMIMRLVFEMRQCRASLVVMTLVGLTFGAGVVAHFAWLPTQLAEFRVPIEEGCEMGGSLLLLLAMCVYARFVILDSQGLVTARPKKEPKGETTERRGLFGRRAKVDAAHTSVRPSSKRSDLDPPPAKQAAVQDEDEEDDTDDERDDSEESDEDRELHKLSKSERKALRRQQERQRKQRLG